MLCISKINQKHIEPLMIGTTKLQIKRKSGYFWKGSSKNHSVNLSSSPKKTLFALLSAHTILRHKRKFFTTKKFTNK